VHDTAQSADADAAEADGMMPAAATDAEMPPAAVGAAAGIGEHTLGDPRHHHQQQQARLPVPPGSLHHR
jgi:hypothetical protein